MVCVTSPPRPVERLSVALASDELPADPDLDHVPSDLRILAGLDDGRVTVLSDDGVGPAMLVIVPAMFAHEHRVTEDE